MRVIFTSHHPYPSCATFVFAAARGHFGVISFHLCSCKRPSCRTAHHSLATGMKPMAVEGHAHWPPGACAEVEIHRARTRVRGRGVPGRCSFRFSDEVCPEMVARGPRRRRRMSSHVHVRLDALEFRANDLSFVFLGIAYAAYDPDRRALPASCSFRLFREPAYGGHALQDYHALKAWVFLDRIPQGKTWPPRLRLTPRNIYEMYRGE